MVWISFKREQWKGCAVETPQHKARQTRHHKQVSGICPNEAHQHLTTTVGLPGVHAISL